MEYYSAIKKNDILPSATTCIELEGIMLSEISQRKTNIIWLNSYEDFKIKTDEHKGRETKLIQKQGEGQNIRDSQIWRTNRGLLEGLWGGGWAKWVRGIKESTPEITVTLSANLDLN